MEKLWINEFFIEKLTKTDVSMDIKFYLVSI